MSKDPSLFRSRSARQGLHRGGLRVQVRVRHELAAAWPTSDHCYGDFLAHARHPSTPSRPRVCRTPCSPGYHARPLSRLAAQEDVWWITGLRPAARSDWKNTRSLSTGTLNLVADGRAPSRSPSRVVGSGARRPFRRTRARRAGTSFDEGLDAVDGHGVGDQLADLLAAARQVEPVVAFRGFSQSMDMLLPDQRALALQRRPWLVGQDSRDAAADAPRRRGPAAVRRVPGGPRTKKCKHNFILDTDACTWHDAKHFWPSQGFCFHD